MHYMIEVFKTDIRQAVEASYLVEMLQGHFPGCRINVDMHDCDRVLRIEGLAVKAATVVKLLQESGYACSVLE